jgi:hypothetical protein
MGKVHQGTIYASANGSLNWAPDLNHEADDVRAWCHLPNGHAQPTHIHDELAWQ